MVVLLDHDQKKRTDELNSVTDVVNIDDLGKRDPWYTMFRMSLLCYLLSELTEIRFFFKAYNIFSELLHPSDPFSQIVSHIYS
jgi:hypothetical protein